MARFISTAFSPCPWPLMDAAPTNIKANAISIYLVLHRRGFGESDGRATVPMNEISAEAGVGQKATRTALRWLVNEGWITRVDQIGEASFYRVWTDEPKRTPRKSAKGSTPGKSARGSNGTPGKSAKGSRQNCQGNPRQDCQGHLYMKNIEKKEEKKSNNSPSPFPPSPATATETPQPAAAPDPIHEPKRATKPAKTKPAKLTITAADVEHSLPPGSVENYVRWWNEVREGRCTERALEAELAQIRLIENDPAGGSAAAAEQIRKALKKADLGCKAWQAITHENWQRYGGAQSAARAPYRKPAPWENEHGRSLVEQARFEGLI